MKKIRAINIDEKFWEMLKIISQKNNRSMSNMIEILIEEYSKQNKE